ncbi:hypothetical protein GCM10008932_09270 [Alkalibacterium iburiense]|uniref:Beta-galactosidase n=1 Tax=Alkalibacterium iburiense TaxID=290589 RepID=A0ABN0XAI1_9LACT
MNQIKLFTQDWQFAKVEGLSHEKPNTFEPVELPHDWLIGNTRELYQDSVGWYKKTLNYEGDYQTVSLLFDGVYMDSTLYVNDTKIGEWKYGYSAFEMDISEALVKGENDILLKVVHQSPNSRWYTGAGIYRNVWIKLNGPSYIETDGLYISSHKENQTYRMEIETDVQTEEPIKLKHTLFKKDHLIQEVETQVSEKGTVSLSLEDLTVEEWEPDAPHLYELETVLMHKESDEVLERRRTRVGFKTVNMDPDKGFILNGKRMKLKGVCEHHDFGALGSAFNTAVLRRRFTLLKEMGVNAIRTSHNMPARELMELADEMGFLIVSESFDMWERPKTTYDYARFFKEWAYKDIRSWVKRDRNHVSLIMWTIGNEIYDTHADERGLEIAKQLDSYIKEFDPKSNAVVTIGSNYMPWENAQKVADFLKVAGYNYGEKYYEDHHEAHPDWIIYGSETGSVVQSRGIYHFPYKQSVLADDDEQCSALGNSSTSWGADTPEEILTYDRDTPFSMGQFIWTGFDYIGEPTPYHTKNSYFGQIDTATFPKDTYYIYQSAWTHYKDKPMIHLFPYWDFNPGQTIDVRVATNAPKVVLYLNDEVIGEKHIDHQNDTDITPTWQIPYEPGELKAIAYDEQDVEIGRSVRRSFRDAKELILTADKPEVKADGRDLIFVEIGALDAEGNPVENATNRVEVHVSGAGRLVGLDNGDSTDYDQYKGISRRLFSGKAMAIIQATTETGPIEVEVSSNNIKSAQLTLHAVEAETVFIKEAQHKNTERAIETGQSDELPVRKIELTSSNGLHLHPDNTETIVEATLYPENTTYTDLEWSIVNDAGVEMTHASLIVGGPKAIVTAKGDGPFRVRCTTKNGTDKIKLISELDMTITDMGTAYKNPYELISGSLLDDSMGDVSNGNERGVATSRDGETIVGYHEIDFGAYGSDTITLPLFTLSDENYVIEIWEGHPKKEGSILLKEAHYQKVSKWNVYQEESYQLSKRLTGVTSLYFMMHAKVHLKGFYFEKQNRAFSYNKAVEADFIYGDAFEQTEEEVRQIGNNVSLIFEDMDFSDKEAGEILIEGHSPIEKNTIHVRFEGESGSQVNQLVEFTQTNKTESKQFDLTPLSGKGTVTFIFLPGSQFDFKAFQFKTKD